MTETAPGPDTLGPDTLGPDTPLGVSIDEEQDEVIAEFAFFDDWMDRYQYLIDLGRKLPAFPSEYRRDEFKLKGCQSQVWFAGEKRGDRLVFHAISDAAIVSGLVAVLLRIYSNRTPDEIVATEPNFITEIGLDAHLSPTRRNGLGAMLQAIRARARAELDAAA
ncbi:MAG: SufE family protein [Alphaproteobacteria bacterium]|nr:SufE family protein [Alphaproteobacteria bacterium]